MKAFILGWHLTELYNYQSLPDGVTVDRTTTPPASLPGMSAFSQLQRAKVLVDQISTELPKVWRGTEPAPTLDPIKSAVDSGAEGADLQWRIYDFHTTLLGDFTVQDYLLGKAYGLGRAVAETVFLADGKKPGSYSDQFAPYRTLSVVNWLSDLKTALPDHSAICVEVGLATWTDWIARNPDRLVPGPAGQPGARPRPWSDPKESARIAGLLKKQGDLWRSLLSGEKDGASLMQANDYFKAVRAMAGRVAELAFRFLGTPVGAALGVVTLIAFGVLAWLLLRGNATQIPGAVVAALGSFGITVGSATAAVKKALSQAEKPLWDAEVTAAIVTASLHTPEDPASSAVGRRLLASIDFHSVEQTLVDAASTIAQEARQGRP